MVDFIKAVIPPESIGQLERNRSLVFRQSVDTRTGEILENRKIAEYKNLKVTIYSREYAELTGSLHKFYNGGFHNANDFSLVDLLICIKQIEVLFGIDLAHSKLSNIELGVNLLLSYKVSKILNCLMLHQTQCFKDVSIFNGNYKQAMHTQYSVKAYDKGKQYAKQFPQLPSNILRIEVKFNKMKKLNDLGIYTMADLFNYTNLASILSLLETAWNGVLMYDKSIRINELKTYERTVKLNAWQNKNYWMELSKQRRSEQKKKYYSIVENHSDEIHLNIKESIKNKWVQLIDSSLPIYRIINEHCVTILPFEYDCKKVILEPA
jgi:hypothetical protein